MAFWDDKKPPKETFVTKDDINELEMKLEKAINKPVAPENSGKKLIKGMAKGIGQIAESLNEPDSEKRPRISRISQRKAPIARTRVENPIAGRNAGMKRHHISNAPLD